ncbi:MAG: histidine kinase [Robiginitomaculum sp.]|nr:MAG: histidine kinase [Robiginitomaculum sp.]
MTRFLVSEENPNGSKLEDLLVNIRSDILHRCTKIADDQRPEAMHVLANNVMILEHLTEAIQLALDSTKILDTAFGKSQADKGGPPRIGIA